MNRDNQVAQTFRFSDDTLTRTFTFIGGLNAVSASGQLPPEIRLLDNGLVVFEDFVIYRLAQPPDLEALITLDFDLSVIVVGPGQGNTIQTDFAVGTVALIPPPPGVCDYIIYY